MLFLRQLRTFHLSQAMMVQFYTTIHGSSIWSADHSKFQQSIGCREADRLPPTIFITCTPLALERFKLLPFGRRLQSIRIKTFCHKDRFIIPLVNIVHTSQRWELCPEQPPPGHTHPSPGVPTDLFIHTHVNTHSFCPHNTLYMLLWTNFITYIYLYLVTFNAVCFLLECQ